MTAQPENASMVSRDPNRLSSFAGDAVKAEPAPLTESSRSVGGAGDARTPWRIVHEHDALAATVKDFDGNELFTASVAVAARAVSAVNAYVHLFGINIEMVDALKALQAQLSTIPSNPAIKRALDLIETTLNPDRRDG